MPLDDLTGVIETLQGRIRQHGASLRENETRTRMALIDPLLRALGWNVADPALVMPEYSVGGGRADYALLDSSGKPAATVEAKRLGESLESHRMQMVNYANMSGIPYAGLTDGNQWELYEVFAQKPIEERRRLQVSITGGPAHQSALKLLLLWRPNLASGRPTAANEPILAPPQSEPQSQLPLPPARVVPIPAQTLPAPVQSGWVALSSFSRGDTTKPPTAIRFSDGIEHPVQYWRHLVERTAYWLWTTGKLTLENIPVPASSRRFIVNTEPIHPSGKRFTDDRQISGTPLVAEVNINARLAIDQSQLLLNHCGVNPADVFVQTAP